MYASNPEKITNNLVGRANLLLSNWPPSEFQVLKLQREAKKLRGVSAHDYDMLLGMCSAMLGNLDLMKQQFQRAVMKSGGDDDIVLNYSRSLSLWHLYGEAADILVKHAQPYRDSVEYSAEVVQMLLRAGRFHEASRYYGSLSMLGPAAESHAKEYAFVPALAAALLDLGDDAVAPAVEHFGLYLREIGAVQVDVTWDVLDSEDTGQELAGVEIIYFIEEEPEAAAALNYEGSKFLAEKDYAVERSGRLIFSIQAREVDADQAA